MFYNRTDNIFVINWFNYYPKSRLPSSAFVKIKQKSEIQCKIIVIKHRYVVLCARITFSPKLFLGI